MKRVVVDCDGAIVPQVASVPEPPIRRSLNHRGQSANVNLQIRIPATALLAGIDGRSGDLVRIASYVYAADQSVSRGGEADVYGDGWRRHFVVYIPVTDLEFWSQEPVSQALSDALGFVSGDVWNFQFSQAVPEQRQLTLDIDPSQVFGEPDSVYLFSGGLDSLAAVLEGAVQTWEEAAAGKPLSGVQHRKSPTQIGKRGSGQVSTNLVLPAHPGWNPSNRF